MHQLGLVPDTGLVENPGQVAAGGGHGNTEPVGGGLPTVALDVLERERRLGGKIWVDLQCKLLHLGQHNFRGDLAESLKLQGRW